MAALRNAHERNKEDLKALKDDLKAFKDARSKEDEEGLRRKGDVDALEKSWQAKLDKVTKEKDALVAAREGSLKQILVTSEARKLAAELSTHPDLITRFIEDRLAADFDGDMPKTRVLGADGKLSASTLDDLKKEFLADKRFEAILIGSKGSGGGAGGSKAGGGAFKLDDFKNTDGTVNWGKVNAVRVTNPDIVTQVQEALTGAATAQ